jgi:hypothetical protein
MTTADDRLGVADADACQKVALAAAAAGGSDLARELAATEAFAIIAETSSAAAGK